MKQGIVYLTASLMLWGCGTPNRGLRVYGPYDPDDAPRTVQRSGTRRNRSPQPREPVPGEFVQIQVELEDAPFEPEIESTAQSFANEEELAAFSETAEKRYLIGPGDRFSFLVRGREDISREDVVVAPDGLVALPRVGVFSIKGMTIPEATEFVTGKLTFYYDNPEVSLLLTHINNNQVFVLGRVAKPGAVHFSGRGTLLEALSLAGGLPADTRGSFLSRCMIVRGNDMIIWVDLRELLERGNISLNTRLQNGDFIYIPQSDDQLAYILGEVPVPGVLVLRSQMTLLDAVMRSGGPTPNADPRKVFLVRSVDGRGVVEQINMQDMVQKGDLRRNYVLKDGDIVLVGRSGMGSFNTFITQLMPGMRAVDFTINTAEAFGAMAELRNRIWGQEGFINRTSD
jgi:polysaccharide export outer membrane protein